MSDDEENRKLLKPDPSSEEVVVLVKSNFAMEEDVEIIKDLDSYDDRNYWVKIGGVDHLVKVHNGVESLDLSRALEQNATDSVIQFQYEIMKVLAENGVQASRPKQDLPIIQDLPVVSKAHSPCKLAMSVYTWVPGNTMAALKMLPIECLADAGRFLGDLHHKFDKISADKLTAAKRYHQWDGKHTADLKDFLYCIQDEGRRTMVASVLEAFQTHLIESGVASTFRKSVNHGDFNDANILLDKNFKVSGVIDFGDSTESWTVLDVSVCMAYSMLSAYGKSGRSLSAAAAVLRGFHSVYPLLEVERKHLTLLVACRLACSVTLGAYSFNKNPENTYLLLHAEPAWQALELLWGTDLAKRKSVGEAMDTLLDVACSSGSCDEDGIMICTDLAIPDEFIFDWLAVKTKSSKRQRL